MTSNVIYLTTKNPRPISVVMTAYAYAVINQLRYRHRMEFDQACTSVITWLADVMEAQSDGVPVDQAADTIVYLQRSQTARAIRQE